MTPFSRYHSFSGFLPPKTRGRLEIVLPAFLQELSEGSRTCGLFIFDFAVKFIPLLFKWILVR